MARKLKKKDSINPPSAFISPFSIFRPPDSVSGHGCVHLANIKYADSIKPSVGTAQPASVTTVNPLAVHMAAAAACAFGEPGRALLNAYREAVRHSLGHAARSQINLKRVAQLSKKAEEDDGADGNSKKRKKQTGLDSEILAVEQLSMPGCATCEDSLGRLHMCLHCNTAFCSIDQHLHNHMEERQHNYAVDFSHQTLFCSKCNDYVYDIDFDRILVSEKLRMDSLISRVKDPAVKRLRHGEWSPAVEEVAKIKMMSSPVKRCSGLRGLRNMGSTAFVHNPLLRAHFMSDMHNQELCKIKSAKQVCIACEMDNLYMNFYNGQNAPFGPTSFLYSVWKSTATLATYAQQDAHEFFMAVLNEVHNNCSGSTDHAGNGPVCRCIIHNVFSGVLQSEVTCQKCHNITTTNDPIFDLSLNIRATKAKSKSSKKKSATAEDSGKGRDDGCTLIDCLEKLENFSAEKLTAYQCGNPECAKTEISVSTSTSGSKDTESVKHVTAKHLPPILAIQLKRFEHSGQGSKVETFVQFPIELDMSPFTTRSVKSRTRKSKKESGIARKSGQKGLTPFDPQTYDNFSAMFWRCMLTPAISDSVPEYRYTLFAVINHQGKLETGHYTAYVKTRGEWFFFDDHNVQLSSQKDVLASKAYMCFYMREGLIANGMEAVDATAPIAVAMEISGQDEVKK
ncbi:hypothetical protein HK101_007294 [Irineochytrium annulatum]|nr:hypothetical protein HK101_007294 [Irineochytrium annulatum]